MDDRAHIIVLGNEKGGSGKSTTAMHLISAIAQYNKKVGALDVDVRQRSLSRYIENRIAFNQKNATSLTVPQQRPLTLSRRDTQADREQEELASFTNALKELCDRCDFVVIDTPGADSYLSRLAHASADTLITPINDSVVDFDLLAETEAGSGKIVKPSIYAEMVWECRKLRSQAALKPIDWVVMRNRMSMLDARNKRRVGAMLSELSKRIGFRITPGFCERVIYRELFAFGLTLLDMDDDRTDIIPSLTMSHIAARRELFELLSDLRLPGLKDLP